MKKAFKFLSILALLTGAALGQTTVSVTVDFKQIFSTAQANKVQACFSLVDGNGQQINNPRVTTSGVLVNTTNVCQGPDGSGHLAITLYANDAISPSGSLYQVIYLYSNTPVHGDTYQFLVADGTENLNLKTPVTQSALITPPTGDTTYARLDTGNQPFTGPIRACAVSGTLTVGSVCYPTLQSAITASCGASPVSPIYLPPGTYAAPNVAGFTGLCNGLHIQGTGRGQADSVTCPATVTTNQTSGVLFDETSINDIVLSDFCIKDLGAAGTAVAIKRSATQRSVNQNLYISGPFSPPLLWQSSSTATSSTIWNWDLNVHTTGTATGGTGCLFDAQDGVSKVINNNYLFNVSCTGGTGGFGLKTQSTTSNPIINEIEVHSGELVATGGTAVSIGANTVRDFKCQNCNVEGSSSGVVIAAGNTGEFDSSNISANGNNSLGANVSDSSGVGGFFWPGSNHIGGQAPSPFRATLGGDVSVNSLSFGAAASNGSNTWNFVSGAQAFASGTITMEFDNTQTQFFKPQEDQETSAPSGSVGACFRWDDPITHRYTQNCNNTGAKVQATFGDTLGVFAAGGNINPAQLQVNGGSTISLKQRIQNQTTGSINATTRTEILVSWPSTMTDTNYTVSCSVQDSSTAAGTQGLTFERIRTKSATQVGLVINNPTAGGLTGSIDCIGEHQ